MRVSGDVRGEAICVVEWSHWSLQVMVVVLARVDVVALGILNDDHCGHPNDN